jgi:hypothetical protein
MGRPTAPDQFGDDARHPGMVLPSWRQGMLATKWYGIPFWVPHLRVVTSLLFEDTFGPVLKRIDGSIQLRKAACSLREGSPSSRGLLDLLSRFFLPVRLVPMGIREEYSSSKSGRHVYPSFRASTMLLNNECNKQTDLS